MVLAVLPFRSEILALDDDLIHVPADIVPAEVRSSGHHHRSKNGMNQKLFVVASCLLISVAACSGDDTSDDTGGDTGDAASDSGDTAADATDTAAETSEDAGPDSVEDVDPGDVLDSGDVVPDAIDDVEEDTHEEPHFAYEGENGPENWGSLDERWTTCGEGTEQSPIDISSAIAPTWVPGLSFEYGETSATIQHKGHTIEVEVEEGTSSLYLGDARWDLVQFHFHVGSEHSINGEHAPAEMHMVHRNELGDLAVVGVFVLPAEDGEIPLEDPFDFILANAPAEAGPAVEYEDVLFNPSDLFDTSAAYWHYDGSLTTPPCSEGVSWYVLSEATFTSPAFVEMLETNVGLSARPTQQLNDRTIEGAHWSYHDEETGPDAWGELSPFFSQCSEGMEQSPIDIPGEIASSEVAISYNYPSVALNMENNGHTVEVEVADGSTVTIEGETWELAQFHFHVGSEHTVAGGQSVGEVHFVHRNEIGALAVVAARLEAEEAPEDSGPYAAILANLPTEPHSRYTDEATMIEPASLLPDSNAMWRYDGSLTTPPCTEGVSWHVLSTPMLIPTAQAEALEAAIEGSFRPVQPLNGREIR
jgi:carbonic anhydrase